MPCRFNRRRVWAHRIMLEALQHGDCTFVTLTYDDEHLPPDGSLQPADLQGFLKRLRRSMEPRRLRFYAVGEYGDTTKRPHYHAALFGVPNCSYGVTRTSRLRAYCCEPCSDVARSWSRGHTMLGDLSLSSAGYIAGYVTKKMTKADDPRLGGRHPEFARMSLKPGIGMSAMHEVASQLLRLSYDSIDVPVGLRHGPSVLPLGRYLRSALRELIGRDKRAPPEVLAQLQAEVSHLFQASLEIAPTQARPLRPYIFRDLLAAASHQRALSLEARQKVYSKKGTI